MTFLLFTDSDLCERVLDRIHLLHQDAYFHRSKFCSLHTFLSFHRYSTFKNRISCSHRSTLRQQTNRFIYTYIEDLVLVHIIKNLSSAIMIRKGVNASFDLRPRVVRGRTGLTDKRMRPVLGFDTQILHLSIWNFNEIAQMKRFY